MEREAGGCGRECAVSYAEQLREAGRGAQRLWCNRDSLRPLLLSSSFAPLLIMQSSFISANKPALLGLAAVGVGAVVALAATHLSGGWCPVAGQHANERTAIEEQCT